MERDKFETVGGLIFHLTGRIPLGGRGGRKRHAGIDRAGGGRAAHRQGANRQSASQRGRGVRGRKLVKSATSHRGPSDDALPAGGLVSAPCWQLSFPRPGISLSWPGSPSCRCSLAAAGATPNWCLQARFAVGLRRLRRHALLAEHRHDQLREAALDRERLALYLILAGYLALYPGLALFLHAPSRKAACRRSVLFRLLWVAASMIRSYL